MWINSFSSVLHQCCALSAYCSPELTAATVNDPVMSSESELQKLSYRPSQKSLNVLG